MSTRLAEAFTWAPTTRYYPTDRLLLPDLLLGIEIEVENCDKPANGATSENEVPGQVAVKGRHYIEWLQKLDGSVHKKGREYVCGPVSGRTLIEHIEGFCEFAAENKFTTSIRTGLHVHLDCTHKTTEFVGHLVATYMAVEHALYSYCGAWRKYCGFCNSLGEAEYPLETIRTLIGAKNPREVQQAVRELGRYSGMNLASLFKFGTVEFRMFSTTYEADKIILWINILESIYKYAEWLEENNTTVQQQVKTVGPEGLFRSIFTFPGTIEAMMEHYSERHLRRMLFHIRTLGLDPYTPAIPLNTVENLPRPSADWEFDWNAISKVADLPFTVDVVNPALKAFISEYKEPEVKPEPATKKVKLNAGMMSPPSW